MREKTELSGMSALHKACQYGRIANVEKLIQEGADVNVKNHWFASLLNDALLPISVCVIFA